MNNYCLLSILSLLLANVYKSFGQDTLQYEDAYRLESISINTQEYLDSIVSSDFSDVFYSKETQQNYKRLRDYKAQKEILIRELSKQERIYYNSRTFLEALKIFSSTIKDYFTSISPDKGIYLIPYNDQKRLENTLSNAYLPRQIYQKFYSVFRSPYYAVESSTNVPDSSRLSTIEKEGFIEFLQQQEAVLDKEVKIYDNLTKNIEIAKLDLILCEDQLDRTLAPEYNRQNFKENISLYFTILIGILLVLFFFIVYKKSGIDLSKELLGGNGLQFVTLFVLIIAIILFGILEILQGSELAAILAGISGYILGKGVKSDSTG